MATMTKAQRDYAVKRAQAIIKEKYPITKLPSLNFNEKEKEDFAKMIGFESLLHLQEIISWEADFQKAMRKHPHTAPVFKRRQEARERIKNENKAIEEIISSEAQKAVDFIMLGDAASVLEYLSDLEK